MSRGEQPDTRAATRRSIIDAFLNVYGSKPMGLISVGEVITLVGYARNTFYRYFNCMGDVLQAAEDECTCSEICEHIIDVVGDIDLEEATDQMATFYEERVDAVRVLIRGDHGREYIDRQREAMVPLFRALVNRSFDLTDEQLEYISEYIAKAKAGMIEIWIDKDCKLTLNQISKMSETIIEPAIWTCVALQSPRYGGPRPKLVCKGDHFEYPWINRYRDCRSSTPPRS